MGYHRTIPPSRERQILDAAQGLFFERGFHAIGIDEIGAAAGITGPAIYRHFKSKDEILATLFDEGLDGLLATVGGQSFDADAPLVELRFLAEAHAQYTLENKEIAAVLVRDNTSLADEYRRRHERRERPYLERWVALIQRAFPARSEAEATTAMFAAVTVLNSVGTWPPSARRADGLATLISDLAMGCVLALGDSQR